MDLCIIFRPPARSGDEQPVESHERHLDGVPPSTVEKMTDDFQAHQDDPSNESQCKLYRYQKHKSSHVPTESADDEVLVALDFGEITDIQRRTSAALA